MATLIGDRFLIRVAVGPDFRRAEPHVALDLATGTRVRVCIAVAGTRTEQQTWTDSCAREHAEGVLLDFGFIGSTHRFEARADGPGRRQSFCAQGPAAVVGWLEHSRPSSPRILHVAELPDPRVIRQRGFVPCNLAVLHDTSRSVDVSAALAGRSVVVLDSCDVPSSAALGLLRLSQLAVREFCVLARRTPSKDGRVTNAAEGRAAYGPRMPLADPRMAHAIVDVERLLTRGRHAAAERALRGAVAAFERRGDFRRAGDAALRLGRLLLGRGRAADAKTLFTDAHDRCQRARAAEPAIEAMVYLGLAETDLAQLQEAEQTCRAAYSAASALGSREIALFPALALARALLWQKRHADARAILEAVEPAGDVEQCARVLVHGRTAANRRQCDIRCMAARGARAPSCIGSAASNESIVRRCEAAVQGGLGDVDALRIHVTSGLVAARGAHLPLQAIKLRVTYVEGLIRAERMASARAAARHLAHGRPRAIPPLLKSRIDGALGALQNTPSVHESPARFHVTTSRSVAPPGPPGPPGPLGPLGNDVEDLKG